MIHTDSPVSSVISPDPTPAVRDVARAIRVSSASAADTRANWASTAPNAIRSGAPSSRSSTPVLSRPRAAASRDSRLDASRRVYHGTTVAPSTRAGGQHGPRTGQEVPRKGHRRDDHEERAPERRDHFDHQILQGVNVLNQAGEQIAAPERRQPGGSERLEPFINPDPQIGQGAEGGVVADHRSP